MKTRNERENNRRKLRKILFDERQTIKQISELRLVEIRITRQIQQIIRQIQKFENEIRITISNENKVSIQIKNILLQKSQLHVLLKKLDLKIREHKRLYEQYRKEYHSSLDFHIIFYVLLFLNLIFLIKHVIDFFVIKCF